MIYRTYRCEKKFFGVLSFVLQGLKKW